MFANFKSLTFANILSYGNKKTTVHFEKGLNLISGKNAQGKSTVIDALSFALYGQPYRKIKIKELINRRNRKGLFTEVVFNIDTDKYKITRTLEPTNLIIEKNEQELELLSTKKLSQNEIDNIIGINYNLFRHIISLAVNYNKPFLSLISREKRDIMESIFNIKIFGEMSKLSRKNNAGLKLQSDTNRAILKGMEQSLKSLNKQLIDFKRTQKDFDKNKDKDIKTVDKNINIFDKEKTQINNKIFNHTKELGQIFFEDSEKLKISKEEIGTNIGKMEYIVSNGKRQLKLILENDDCPVCEREMDEEHKQKETEKINFRIKKSQVALPILNENLEGISIQIENNNELEKKKIEIETNIEMINERIKFIDKQLLQLQKNKLDVETRELKFDIDGLQKIFDTKKKEYLSLKEEYKRTLHSLYINDIIGRILSDTGIKAFFFKKLIPVLNKKINEYLNQLGLPLQLIFDEYMEETIINLSSSGNKDVPYHSLSGGERKRVDMAILFSFIAIAKMICNWNCNLIIMDEILDSSVDDEGLDKLIASLKKLIFASKENLSVYIISHRDLEDENFTRIYQIEKKDNFSLIKELD